MAISRWIAVQVFVWIFLIIQVSGQDPCFTDGEGRQQRCSQICEQDGGKYACSCLDGYRLTEDGHSCDKIGQEEPAMFYISGSNKIMKYFPEEQSLLQTTLTNTGSVTDFAFGPDRTLYWTDKKRRTVSCIQFDESFTANMEEVIVDSGLESPNGISFDWFTDMLYIVDTQTGTIAVCTIKGDNCAVLLRDLVSPQEVVVEPVNRRIFWTDSGWSEGDGAIHSADTDGFDRKPLAEGIERPTDLVVDRESRAVFWLAYTSDSGDPVVQMVYWDNDHTRGVHTFQGAAMRPAFLLILSQLYIHDNVDVADVVNVTGNIETRATSTFLPRDGKIKVYNGAHFLAEIKDNKCAGAPCSHVCVHSENLLGYQCLCPLGMELVFPSTCKKTNVYRLLTSGDRVPGIYEVPIQYIGLSSFRPRQLVPRTVSCFAYGSDGQVIVYNNEDTQTLERTSLVNLSNTTVLYYIESGIEGITIHETTGFIYWTNRQGQVRRGTLNGGLTLTIIEGLDRPRGIAVDSDNSHLYVCDWGSGLILRCQTDSGNPYCEHVVRAPRGHPNDVIIHQMDMHGEIVKFLIWTDSKLDHIGLLPLSGNETKREIPLNETSMPHPYALAAVGTRVFYTDLNSGAIHIVDQAAGLPRDLVIVLDLGSLHSVAVFRYIKYPAKSDHGSGTQIRTNMTQIWTSIATQDTDDVIWIVGVAAALIIIATVAIAAIYLYRQRMQKGSWLSDVIQYVKEQPREDSQHLMSHIAASNPGFLNLEDLDYPEVYIRRHHNNSSREFSTISADSAFTEMHDFSSSPTGSA